MGNPTYNALLLLFIETSVWVRRQVVEAMFEGDIFTALVRWRPGRVFLQVTHPRRVEWRWQKTKLLNERG